MVTIRLELDMEATAVLLRCLVYGENAVSVAEHTSGVADVIERNISKIRRQITGDISVQTINNAVPG